MRAGTMLQKYESWRLFKSLMRLKLTVSWYRLSQVSAPVSGPLDHSHWKKLIPSYSDIRIYSKIHVYILYIYILYIYYIILHICNYIYSFSLSINLHRKITWPRNASYSCEFRLHSERSGFGRAAGGSIPGAQKIYAKSDVIFDPKGSTNTILLWFI